VLIIACCSQTLESLCTNLYDALRPLIIHINHLETLAELCSILKVCSYLHRNFNYCYILFKIQATALLLTVVANVDGGAVYLKKFLRFTCMVN